MKENVLTLTKIINKNIEYLIEMLKTNTKLLWISLFNNEIGDRRVRLLCTVLTIHNKILQGLLLDENTSISDASINALVDIIKYNSITQELSINKCDLSQKKCNETSKNCRKKRTFDLVL